jgi:hypothetical protein
MARKLPVKWFHYDVMSGAGGAPQLNGLAGSLIQVLDACLIDGFNTHSVVSFIIAGGVGTIEFGTSGHGFVLHQVVGIGGATDDQYNGDWRVTAVNATSIEVDATGVADTTVAGTLTCKTAPVGDWEKAFSGTNKAAYRSTNVDATGHYLRIDDSAGQLADARGYEAMTDIDNGTGPFPTTSQVSASNWGKSSTNNSILRKWMIVADGQFIYFFRHPNVISESTFPSWNISSFFGDFVSFRPGDLYFSCLSVYRNASFGTAVMIDTNGNVLHRNNNSTSIFYVSRNHDQIGSSVESYFRGYPDDSGSISLESYPGVYDGSLKLFDLKLIAHVTGDVIRGRLPGYFACGQHSPLSHGSILDLDTSKVIMVAVAVSSGSGGQFERRFAIDITGPWR